MTLNNHAANGQSQSRSMRLCRKECAKYAIQVFRIDSRSRVFYCDDNCIATTKLSSHPQHPTSIRGGIHCFERVMDQVKDDLLQLISIAINKRQFGCQLGADRNAMILQLSTQ